MRKDFLTKTVLFSDLGSRGMQILMTETLVKIKPTDSDPLRSSKKTVYRKRTRTREGVRRDGGVENG